MRREAQEERGEKRRGWKRMVQGGGEGEAYLVAELRGRGEEREECHIGSSCVSLNLHL